MLTKSRRLIKKLAKKYHPDIFEGNKKFAEEKMKQINEAYSLLSSPYYPNSINEQFEQGYKQSQQAEQKWQEYVEQRRKIYEDLERLKKEMKESDRQWRKRLKTYFIIIFISTEFALAMLLAFTLKMTLYYFEEALHFMFVYSICSVLFILLLIIFAPFLFVAISKKIGIQK